METITQSNAPGDALTSRGLTPKDSASMPTDDTANAVPTQYSPPTEYSSDPRLATLQYGKQPGVPVVVRALCAIAALESGLGDGTWLSLSEEWADAMEEMLQDEYPGINVQATLRSHLAGVCKVAFHIDEIYPPRTPYKRVPFTTAEALAVFDRDGYQCRHCGARQNLSVDHIHPVSRGGTNDSDNLQTLCRSCNSRKGAR